MKVSKIKTIVTEKDIMGLISDFVKIENLSIKEINIHDTIILSGSYKKGIDINFSVNFGISNVHNNIIYLKVFKLKIAKFNINSFFINSGFKILESCLREIGIKIDKEKISIDLNILEKSIPNVYFKLNSVKILENALEIEADEIIYSTEKKAEKKKEKVNKIDRYGTLRKKCLIKIPEKYRKIGEYAFILPDVIDLYYNLLKDQRVPKVSKVSLLAVVIYLASPIDLIPDFLAVIGGLDDVVIAFFGLSKILNDVDDQVITENYHGNGNIIIIIKEVINIIYSYVGGKRITKIYEFISSIFSKEKNK